jgi:hypothetical protein
MEGASYTPAHTGSPVSRSNVRYFNELDLVRRAKASASFVDSRLRREPRDCDESMLQGEKHGVA